MQSANTKGLLVGLANLGIVGLLIGLGEARHFQESLEIAFFIAVAGCGPALAVGALAGWVAGRLVALRRIALVSMALMAIIALGAGTEPALIKYALLPTVASALWLERWTRENLDRRVPSLMTMTTTGMLLGAANVVAVSVTLAIYILCVEPRFDGDTLRARESFQFAGLVFCFGMIPGIVTGGIAGYLAQQLRGCSQLTRYAGIASVALSGVFALGALANAPELVMPALMPTLFNVCVLERLSRRIEPLPAARLHRAA